MFGQEIIVPVEASSRPNEITPVLEEHVTPLPAIISTPTVVRDDKILGMDRKTAKIVGGISAALLLIAALK